MKSNHILAALFPSFLKACYGAPNQPLSRQTSNCTVTTFDGIASAVSSCTNIILDNIAVPGGSTLDLNDLQDGSTVTFSGTTTFGYNESNYNMIEVGGTSIIITASASAIIDGNGNAWWDGQGTNGGVTKPHYLMSIKADSSTIHGLYIQNYPAHCFSVSGVDGLQMYDIILNNTAGNAPNNRSDGLPAAHNSDGWDVSSTTNSVIRDSTVLNQDDCVAVTSGDNITVSGMHCDGSHGLSIGSVGGKSDNNVTNIRFSDSTILNSENGARIKTNYNTTGYIAGISYTNIMVSNISDYGIDIQQDYLNGGPTGTPTSGVIITDVTMTNITGTAQSDAVDYYILCGTGCSNFTFNDISITGGQEGSCNVQTTGDFTC